MVHCICVNCNSSDIILSDDKKYLICNNCGNRDYVKDLEIGLVETKNNLRRINNGKTI